VNVLKNTPEQFLKQIPEIFYIVKGAVFTISKQSSMYSKKIESMTFNVRFILNSALS